VSTGLQEGDEIIEIDRVDVSRSGLQEVERLLLGRPGRITYGLFVQPAATKHDRGRTK
jgi:C-terminal processing protease CtpA/Prc